MKKLIILFVAVVLAVPAAAQGKINPKYIEDSDKPVLMVFTASWCTPCHAMRENVFPHPEVASYLAAYNVLMIDVDTHDGAAYQYQYARKSSQIPHYVIVARSGEIVAERTGSCEAADFVSFLKRGDVTPISGGKYTLVDVPEILKGDFKPSLTFSVGGGANISSLKHNDGFTGTEGIFTVTPCAYIEAAARYQMHPVIALNGGIDFTFNPYKMKTTAGSSSGMLMYLDMPVDISFNVAGPVWLGAGVYGGFKASGLTSSYRNADLGARLHLETRFDKFYVKLLYAPGLLNVLNGALVKDMSNTYHRQCLRIGAGYIF